MEIMCHKFIWLPWYNSLVSENHFIYIKNFICRSKLIDFFKDADKRTIVLESDFYKDMEE